MISITCRGLDHFESQTTMGNFTNSTMGNMTDDELLETAVMAIEAEMEEDDDLEEDEDPDDD